MERLFIATINLFYESKRKASEQQCMEQVKSGEEQR